MRALVIAIAVAACGPSRPAPEANIPPVGPGPDGGPTFSVPPPDGEPTAGGPCRADLDHCCMPDGTLVRPGGCSPMYPDGVQPATERNADGTCRSIECHLKCLPATARIATPGGEVAIDALRVGDAVWSVDAAGRRIEARVAVVSSVPVVSAHDVLEVTLADGRVVRASGGHPDAGGRAIERLAVGDTLDGAAIASVRVVPYAGTHTWDLLPSGPTGAYWADGVLLGSTLR